jgi:hypothetical protein
VAIDEFLERNARLLQLLDPPRRHPGRRILAAQSGGKEGTPQGGRRYNGMLPLGLREDKTIEAIRKRS